MASKKTAPPPDTREMYTVLQVAKDELPVLGGKPWADVIAGREQDLHEVQAQNRFVELENGRTVGNPYCPLNHAWLRQVGGRAFLYIQNWD